MAGELPAISLIIATRNRHDFLRACLERVAAIHAKVPWELILVDNGSTDGTGDVAREFLSSGQVAGRLVCEPRVGLGRARNTGIAAATGEILAFTDDDCYPREDLLDRLVEAFADEGLGVLGGRVLLHDPTDAPVTIQTEERAIPLPRGRVVRPGIVHGANLAVRRSALRTIGGFDPMLGAGTPFPCEDIELVARVIVAGWDGGYFPEPVVYHHHRRKPGPAVDRLRRQYDYGRGAYFAKFILASGQRSMYLRHWYWWLRQCLRDGQGMSAGRELLGGLRLLACRLIRFEPEPRVS
jgi:GT2 family glycosyltransferase